MPCAHHQSLCSLILAAHKMQQGACFCNAKHPKCVSSVLLRLFQVACVVFSAPNSAPAAFQSICGCWQGSEVLQTSTTCRWARALVIGINTILVHVVTNLLVTTDRSAIKQIQWQSYGSGHVGWTGLCTKRCANTSTYPCTTSL